MVNYRVLYKNNGDASIIKEYDSILGKRISKVFKENVTIEEASKYENGKKDYYTKLDELLIRFDSDEQQARLEKIMEVNEALLKEYQGALISENILDFINRCQSRMSAASINEEMETIIIIEHISRCPTKEINAAILDELKQRLPKMQEERESTYTPENLPNYNEYHIKSVNRIRELKEEIADRIAKGLLTKEEVERAEENEREYVNSYTKQIKEELLNKKLLSHKKTIDNYIKRLIDNGTQIDTSTLEGETDKRNNDLLITRIETEINSKRREHSQILEI